MASRSMSQRKSGSWTKVVIFISLYVLLLESLIEWALVLYLYADRRVDSKMTPSLILAIVASFLTVPLVVLHSILAWQYNKVVGFGSQKAILHRACTYLLRLTIIVWLAASVAGLVVVSQQVSCLPESATDGFWKAGFSCALHRAAVIVSVIAFITVCLYFCSRELSERPYDVSLLGVYKHPRATRDGSFISSSTLQSDSTLKSDIYYVCRRPDVTYGTRDYQFSPNDVSEKSNWPSVLQHPTPIHPRPHLTLDVDPGSENSDVLSGSTISPNGTLSRRSPGGSTINDLSSICRTPTGVTSTVIHDPFWQPPPLFELPDGSGSTSTSTHKRQKSSLSSLRRLLPKTFPLSLPLSADPQIRALADPNVPRDVEKQIEPENTKDPKDGLQSQPEYFPKESSASSLVASNPDPPKPSLPRSMTTNSAEAPEAVIPEKVDVHRSNTTQTGPIQTVYQHHPKFTSVPISPLTLHPLNRAPSHRASVVEPDRIANRHSMRHSDRRRSQRQFEPVQVPRYTRSQHLPQTRWSKRGRAEPRRMWSQSRRNDAEVNYPSTRRSRSSTCGGFSSGHLDCIRETGTSIDEPRGDIFSDNSYRGTSRTSMHKY
ncbi:hypothetical protein P170DRAFT_481102 [Aspergillus steynii IBT 23096]|uniref:Uncharacterized protein n=1 Tax=Aspergillus steynii IBT 23096 TaxID=1392250 RepID=A0A2I2FRB0_9EURO|nr:uncharacterized protein P170DRAFT_481102 [Aspergillus steynii IBT 23096]PLB43151.1 hypothetical protein P170DRAFT_481102 [Aspergillus steynii IBT 23096]